jgi:hypothetical protein
MKPYVTVFGSCRQYSIADNFPTSTILEKLNYPHYSKEILQQIKYLKYRNISDEDTKYCFRAGLLSYGRQSMTDIDYSKLKNEFDKSDVFIVEIASRLCYKWNDKYMHHIATEPYWGFYDRANIKQYDLTDEEIEEDIVQIRNELYPKPFIIVSHFATYEHGKRYELTQLLQRICGKFNIPFINQSDIIRQHGIGIIRNEEVFAHYTNDGHAIVSKIYMEKINNVVDTHNANKPTKLYQVYYTSIERQRKYTFHGFGDYIRGTTYLYQFLKDKNVELKVNFSNHHLSNVFVCDNHLTLEECENTKHNLKENEKWVDYKCVFTNSFELTDIDSDCKKFIIRNCMTPRIGFSAKISNIKKKLSIKDYDYSVIHIRLADGETFYEERLQRIMHYIHMIHSTFPNDKCLLIASNETYLPYINLPFILKTQLARGHVGHCQHTALECEDTMVEFMLMTTAKHINQLSVYDWGSGFSDTVHKLFDVPIKKYLI